MQIPDSYPKEGLLGSFQILATADGGPGGGRFGPGDHSMLFSHGGGGGIYSRGLFQAGDPRQILWYFCPHRPVLKADLPHKHGSGTRLMHLTQHDSSLSSTLQTL